MSQRIDIEGEIPIAMAGRRLDQGLATLLPDYSRNRLANWIKSGDVLLDGKACRPKDVLAGGELYSLHAELVAEVAPSAESIPLEILFQDDALLVINKPASLVVHPGAGNPDGTLMNALLHHAPQLAGIPRAGIVHRLDKMTSGVMVVAANLQSHNALVAAMANRDISRDYEAVVNGVFTAGGKVDAMIGRHPVDRKRMAVVGNGRPAVTHYRVIEKFRAHTFVKLKLETGRTHQIRVHMQHIRHAVVGDPVYGSRPRVPARATESLRSMLQAFPRQALHAKRLEFSHPVTGETISFEAPCPDDISSLVAALRDDFKLNSGNE